MTQNMKSAAYKVSADSMDDASGSASFAPATPVTPDAMPRASLLQAIRSWLRHAMGGPASLKEVLEEAIEEHEEQADERLAPEEKIMLHNVLSFSDIKVSDIMTPRADIAAVPSDITLLQLKSHILSMRHTRIPVYQETLDKVVGFIHVKDLLPMLAGDESFAISDVLRELLFVPPSMRIIDLLVRMRHAGGHMAIVVDEFGGTDGLVTMEDLFEEIVGDIQDEHDEDEQEDKIVSLGGNRYEVSARIAVDKLEKELGIVLLEGGRPVNFDTLGGLIVSDLGRVPSRGESVPHSSGIRFEIVDADARRIRKVRIHAPA